MKNKIYNYLIISILTLSCTQLNAQVTYEDNDPLANSPIGFLGWNDSGNQTLDILQNNTLRQLFVGVNYTSLDGTNYPSASRILFPLDVGTTFAPYSMHHLGLPGNNALRRNWMNIGTTYTDNSDILHVGLLEQPDTTYGGTLRMTDAVIVWGDNRAGTPEGPDNLRFIFIQPVAQGLPGTPTDPSRTDEGQEVCFRQYQSRRK